MPIVAIVREHEVRLERLQLLEVRLDRGALIREEAALEPFDDHLLRRHAVEESLRAGPSLARALGFAAEYDPLNLQVLIAARKREQRASTTDFDVVGVGAKAQDPLCTIEAEVEHLGGGTPILPRRRRRRDPAARIRRGSADTALREARRRSGLRATPRHHR